MGVGRVLGVFREHAARLEIDQDGMQCAEIEVTAASVDTLDENRDHLLRSMDFLDVESHPVIRYRSDDITCRSDSLYVIDGRLSVNGVTHLVQFDMELSPVVTGPDGTECVGATASGWVSRQAFGLRETTDPVSKGTPEGDLILVTATLTLLKRTV